MLASARVFSSRRLGEYTLKASEYSQEFSSPQLPVSGDVTPHISCFYPKVLSLSVVSPIRMHDMILLGIVGHLAIVPAQAVSKSIYLGSRILTHHVPGMLYTVLYIHIYIRLYIGIQQVQHQQPEGPKKRQTTRHTTRPQNSEWKTNQTGWCVLLTKLQNKCSFLF